jgi:hypothetical protein
MRASVWGRRLAAASAAVALLAVTACGSTDAATGSAAATGASEPPSADVVTPDPPPAAVVTPDPGASPAENYGPQGAGEWDCDFLRRLLAPEYAELEPLTGVGDYDADASPSCSYESFTIIAAQCDGQLLDMQIELWEAAAPVPDGPADARERTVDGTPVFHIYRNGCVFTTSDAHDQRNRDELLEIVTLLAERLPPPA